jgi:hypothetical protein
MTRAVLLWLGIAVVAAHACTTRDGTLLKADPPPEDTSGRGGAVVSTIEATSTTKGSGGAGGYIPITVTTSVTTEPPQPTYCDEFISPCLCGADPGMPQCICSTMSPQNQCTMYCEAMSYCQFECTVGSNCAFESNSGANVFCYDGSTCTVQLYGGGGSVACYPFSYCSVWSSVPDIAYIWCDQDAICECQTQNCICEGPGCPMQMP